MPSTGFSGGPFPTGVDDLTAEWFSAALGRDVAEARLVDSSSGTTGRARVQLRGDDVPSTVFVKLRPVDAQQRSFVDRTGMGVAEARFYRDVAAGVPVRTPEVWFADTDGDGYVMVLEDLVASGCSFPRPKGADVAERARDIVEQSARFHARFWQSSRFDDGGDLRWISARADDADSSLGVQYVVNAVDVIGGEMDAAFHELATLYVEHAGDIARMMREGDHTLVHGDLHMGNLFVDEAAGGVTGFLDWAVVGTGPGMRDVSYLLCCSVPVATREHIERDLIARYCECLAETGVVLSPETAWEQHRLHSLASWVACVTTAGMVGKWQSVPVALNASRWTTAACAHLDTVGLLRDRLGV